MAVGHFNFSELVVLKAASAAASELDVPMREIFLNAGHTHSIEKQKRQHAPDLT